MAAVSKNRPPNLFPFLPLQKRQVPRFEKQFCHVLTSDLHNLLAFLTHIHRSTADSFNSWNVITDIIDAYKQYLAISSISSPSQSI